MVDLPETRFLADSMLGRLAKWLRVMGFDTHYQQFYREGEISRLVHDGMLLLSRRRAIIEQYKNSLFIDSDKVQRQLQELRDMGYITRPDRTKWFTRCLACNIPLREISAEDARENIPEYIYYRDTKGIHYCPSCSRYFWPGSHRDNMIRQLEEWGF